MMRSRDNSLIMLTYLDKTILKLTELNSETMHCLDTTPWIDLLNPSKIEEAQIEKYLQINIPSQEEMDEIELSSRLYKEKDTLFMTAIILAQSDSQDPKLNPITFILTPQRLITIRYIEPQAFRLFIAQLRKMDAQHLHASSLLIELLDATIDRLADILESVGQHLDGHSKTIFRQRHTSTKLNYQHLMQQIGASGDLNTKARESLITLNRLITFLGQANNMLLDSEKQVKLLTQGKDIASLSDHANFLSAKVNFLLDAILGMVSIEQNNIIKLFSVAAVIFLPPTLIASIYGMNFNIMPELSWKYGYYFALGLMGLAAWLPYKFFKYKKWL
jgi:magnesium transporter